ncbi:MAG: electron transport complex subunit E [Pseudomonadales bacterium]|nr:electron transport complex subunit E [Pseudomonadales bacterium]
MSDFNAREIAFSGLWKNNPALVQVLGLCPLLAVSASVVNAFGLGFATMLVLMCSNISVSLVRNIVADAIRLPVFVLIIASFTTVIQLLMQAFTYELYQILGIFIPLIVTNCIILGRADSYASRHSVLASAFDGLMMGLGFALVLLVLGIIREAIGSGTIFSQMDLLLGPVAKDWTITLSENYQGFLIASLPPGAFIVCGFLMALKNIINDSVERRKKLKQGAVIKGSKRVRTTGAVS